MNKKQFNDIGKTGENGFMKKEKVIDLWGDIPQVANEYIDILKELQTQARQLANKTEGSLNTSVIPDVGNGSISLTFHVKHSVKEDVSLNLFTIYKDFKKTRWFVSYNGMFKISNSSVLCSALIELLTVNVFQNKEILTHISFLAKL